MLDPSDGYCVGLASFEVDRLPDHLDHEGARYWFCGSGCLRAFAADPAGYLAS